MTSAAERSQAPPPLPPPPRVRPAAAADMPAIAAIVNHYIETTAIHFRTEPQSTDDWVRDWGTLHERYPWLVAEDERAEVIGLAYAGPFKPRAAYEWCAEVTVYAAPPAHRRGVGSALYRRLLDLCDRQGRRSLVAVIALPNPASVALHERFGFSHAGTLVRAGFKLGRWWDVGLWQRLAPAVPPDAPPRPIPPVASLG